MLNCITTCNTNSKTECDCSEMSCETYLHTHQPNYYSSLHVTLYFVKHNNSIPFSKEQLHQANKSFVDCCIDSIQLHVDLMYILVQNSLDFFHRKVNNRDNHFLCSQYKMKTSQTTLCAVFQLKYIFL